MSTTQSGSLNKKQVILGIAVVLLVLFFDQYLKIWVKTHMSLREQTAVVGSWFQLHFIENPGMAFGWKFWGDTGKILLTSFRILAAIGIAIYVLRLIRKGIPQLSVIFFSLILAGAMGNIIDSIFYGQWFTESYPGQLATFADGNGYAPYFKGSVVDMLYFPLFEFYWPDWMPFLKGESFLFFRPVFNIADASITIGVLGMLLFQRSVFAQTKTTATSSDSAENDSQAAFEITNTSIQDYTFLESMYADAYFPDFLVDECKQVLMNLCREIETEEPQNLEELYKLTHFATEKINDLQHDFDEHNSEIETGARESLAGDFEYIAKAYGFDADIEELIAPREW